jgi:SAM-dependent methyltransferase
MYWKKRKNDLYYQMIVKICSNLIKENENYSIIDYGCCDTEVIFDLKCKNKFLLDLNNNYSEKQKQIILEKNIKFIRDSIMSIKWQNKFDICLCLQTIEHLDDPRKAFENIHKSSKKYTIISLPYKWAEFKSHKHNHIDEEIIKEWTQIEPNESFIVRDNGFERIINVYIKR